jgi:hypothetical protein
MSTWLAAVLRPVLCTSVALMAAACLQMEDLTRLAAGDAAAARADCRDDSTRLLTGGCLTPIRRASP